MTFSRKSERPTPRRRAVAAGSQLALVLRTILFGLVAIAGAAGALARHCTLQPEPLRVPVARAAPTYDADAGEFPVPDFYTTEAD